MSSKAEILFHSELQKVLHELKDFGFIEDFERLPLNLKKYQLTVPHMTEPFEVFCFYSKHYDLPLLPREYLDTLRFKVSKNYFVFGFGKKFASRHRKILFGTLRGITKKLASGFKTESYFRQNFNRLMQYSRITEIRHTTKIEEIHKLGDFVLQLSDKTKLHVEIKSSDSGIRTVFPHNPEAKLVLRNNHFVLPLNYKECLQRKIKTKKVFSYLLLLEKDLQRKSMTYAEFKNHRLKNLYY